MKTVLKILLYLLLLLVVLALALPLVVDPNDFKGQITEQVEKRTGRSFVIDGDIKLSVFPWLGVELNQARLGNAPGFGDEPMVQVEQAGVRVKLVPLLQKKLEVDTVVLYGLQANLVRSKEGRANWEAVAEKRSAGGAGGGESETRRTVGPAALLIGGVDVRDAKVSWEDRAAGKSVQLDELNITTSRLIVGQPFDVSADAKVRQLPKGVALSVALNGKVAFDPDGKKIALVPFEAVLAELEGNKSLALQGVVDLDLERGNLELKDVAASTGDLRLKGGLRVANFNQAPNLAGSFNLEPFSPRKLMQGWGMTAPQTADAAVLERCAMSFTLGGTPDRFSLDQIKFQLDDTHVDGNAKVVLAARPTVNFTLKGDGIDLDRYMSPPSGEGGANAAAPLALLFAADMNGTLGLGSLKVNKLKAGNIALKFDQFNGRLQIDQSGAFYQGTYRGMAVVDTGKKPPSLRYTSSMTGLQVGELLKDMQGDSRLEGRGDISAEINSQGADPMAIRKAMTGQIDLQLRDGAIKGFNLAQILRDAKAKFAALQGGEQPAEASGEAAPKTDFSELTAKALIKGLVIDNTALAMKSPYLRVNGQGTLDTEKEWLDYNLRTVVVNSDLGQGGKELSELENIPLPMKYQGPLGEVGDWRKWRIDFEDVLKAKVEQRAKEEIGKFLEKNLGGGQPQPAPAEGGAQPQAQPQSPEQKAMELLRQKIRF